MTAAKIVASLLDSMDLNECKTEDQIKDIIRKRSIPSLDKSKRPRTLEEIRRSILLLDSVVSHDKSSGDSAHIEDQRHCQVEDRHEVSLVEIRDPNLPYRRSSSCRAPMRALSLFTRLRNCQKRRREGGGADQSDEINPAKISSSLNLDRLSPDAYSDVDEGGDKMEIPIFGGEHRNNRREYYGEDDSFWMYKTGKSLDHASLPEQDHTTHDNETSHDNELETSLEHETSLRDPTSFTEDDSHCDCSDTDHCDSERRCCHGDEYGDHSSDIMAPCLDSELAIGQNMMIAVPHDVPTRDTDPDNY